MRQSGTSGRPSQRLVVDGSVDLPEPWRSHPDVVVVPAHLWVDGAPFCGGTAALEQLLVRRPVPAVETQAPSVGELEAAYGDGPDGRPVVAVHVSSDLSATMAHATEAAARVSATVLVVDSRSFSVGAGLVASCLLEEDAGAQGSPEALARQARSLVRRLHTFAAIADLGALRRSGRFSRVTAREVRQHRSLVVAVRGREVPLGQPRPGSETEHELCRHLRSACDGSLSAWALSTSSEPRASALGASMARILGSPPTFAGELSPTVAAHLGPGAIVVAGLARVA